MLLCTVSAGAVTVEVDGRALPSEPAPVMNQGRVLVPMRAVFQALGAEVAYQAGVINATREGRQIVLRLGGSSARVDGRDVALDSPARLVGTVTYVPLRFVAQALGDRVEWQAADRRVIVARSAPAVFEARRQLKRLAVGNQGGVLKVWDEAGQEVVLYRGLDDRNTAPLTVDQQQGILRALGLEGKAEAAAEQVMAEYSALPQREALAFLGVVNAMPQLGPGAGAKVRAFLAQRMESDPQVANRRQAVLALAVGAAVEPPIVDRVVEFYRGSENLWETFPVQQFFEYQASRVRALPEFPQVLSKVGNVNSLYRGNILRYLEG